jgi:hypothetical protein
MHDLIHRSCLSWTECDRISRQFLLIDQLPDLLYFVTWQQRKKQADGNVSGFAQDDWSLAAFPATEN